jgi:hypothetical protein
MFALQDIQTVVVAWRYITTNVQTAMPMFKGSSLQFLCQVKVWEAVVNEADQGLSLVPSGSNPQVKGCEGLA